MFRPLLRTPHKLCLGAEQQVIYNLLEQTTTNVYVTGKAGTGKSVLLRYFVQHTTKAVLVAAPTGIAALHAGGQTIHSLFKLPRGVINPHTVSASSEVRTLLRHVDAIVFDEISMVRSDVLEAIHIKCKLARGNNLPFGGIQIVMFGDVYQLPPVTSSVHERQYLQRTFGGVHFFDASVVAYMQLAVHELNHVYRQQDPEFLQILNTIRIGQCPPELLQRLNARVESTISARRAVTLTATNAAARAINEERLEALRGRERTYFAAITGELAAGSHPTEPALKLKVGSQVMLLRNDTQAPRRWVNGTCAVITKLGKNTMQVAIGRKRFTLVPETWESITYTYNDETDELEANVTGSFVQFPVRLAWAITIHKSQGQTYDTAIINLADGAYAPGQSYVALSRCKSLEGISLTVPLRRADVIIDPRVHTFMCRKLETTQ